MEQDTPHPPKPIDKVTTTILDVALRMCNIELHKEIIDKIIDVVELIEQKGDQATIKDIEQLKECRKKRKE